MWASPREPAGGHMPSVPYRQAGVARDARAQDALSPARERPGGADAIAGDQLAEARAAQAPPQLSKFA
eukprot:4168553-Alexandrium_andersonii.AAC.1